MRWPTRNDCVYSAPWSSPGRKDARPAAGEQNPEARALLADQLGVARNTLSFHLKELAHAGLVSIEQQGRNLIYRAEYGHMNGLIGYLTEHCCQGGVCEVSEPPNCNC